MDKDSEYRRGRASSAHGKLRPSLILLVPLIVLLLRCLDLMKLNGPCTHLHPLDGTRLQPRLILDAHLHGVGAAPG